MKETKDKLLVDLTLERKANADFKQDDLTRRKEFARALGWKKPKKQYDYAELELYEPTWTEIFVELGKLLSARDFRDFEGNLSEIDMRLVNLEGEIKNRPDTLNH